MADLTQRQIKILKCVAEEFIDTAEPVGSENLEKKYNLGISSATIRNEMAALTQLGFLKKSHLSAGRAPTSMGLKYYVRNLMTPKNMSVSDEIGVKEKVWDYRNEFEKLLKETTRELAIKTRSLAISTTDQGGVYSFGASNLLEEPEFYNIDVTKTVLSLLDNPNFWFEIISKAGINLAESVPGEVIHLLVGEDLGMEHLEPCGFIYQTYQAGPHRGIMGVIGPARTHYQVVVPVVDYFAVLISSISR
jgi:heat-inducible transcriptional repressor